MCLSEWRGGRRGALTLALMEKSRATGSVERRALSTIGYTSTVNWLVCEFCTTQRVMVGPPVYLRPPDLKAIQR